jgi:glycosyltransferase involved in cell wall biosynthesis
MRQLRFLQNLKGWITQHSSRFDAVYCDQADADAVTVLSALNQPKPASVVRFDPEEITDVYAEHLDQACGQATTIVVPTLGAHQRAIALGLPRELLVRSSDWSVSPVDRSLHTCREARRMLAEVSTDLALQKNERLIVVPGDMTPPWKIPFLITAIGRLIDQHPGLRLWVLGGDVGRESVYAQLQDIGIHRVVALPGIFTSMDAVLQAADLCVFPGYGCGRGYLIPMCLLSGIPFLAVQSPELQHQLGASASKLCFARDSKEELSQKVRGWWTAPDELQQEIQAAQRQLRRQLGISLHAGSLTARWRLIPPLESSSTPQALNPRSRPAS